MDGLLSHSAEEFFFFNDTATTEIYTLSLHDALPIFAVTVSRGAVGERHRTLEGIQYRRRADLRSEEHTSELQSQSNLVCRLLLEKKKKSSPWNAPLPSVIWPTSRSAWGPSRRAIRWL